MRVTFTFCDLPPSSIDLFPEVGTPSESESQLEEELESPDDVERPESESLSLSSDGFTVGRVWLEAVGEQDLGLDEGVIPPIFMTATFGVGASSSDPESLPSSDEESDNSGSGSGEFVDILASR